MPYDFDNAATDARDTGGSCDWRYDQTLDIRCIVGGGTVSSGWCHALAIMWIKKNFAGVDFLAWFGPATKACPDRPAMNATVGPVFIQLKTIMDEQSKAIDAFNNQPNKTWWAVDYAVVRSVAQYALTPAK